MSLGKVVQNKFFSNNNKYPKIAPSIVGLKKFSQLLREVLTARAVDDPIETLKLALSMSNKIGIALEFGVYQGRTLKIITNYFPGKTFGFDSFEGLPEDWRKGFPRGTFGLSNVPEVENAQIIPGLFKDTLENFNSNIFSPISFIHLDADLYSSTRYVLQVLNSKILPGCVIVFDEFMNYPGFEDHELKAYLEWCNDFGRICKPVAFTTWHEQMAFQVIK